jgi:hypothetical protein
MNIDRSLYQHIPETVALDNTKKNWSELNLLVFERRAFRLQVRYLSHWDEIRLSKYYHNLLQFPTVIMGAVASTAAFTTLQDNTDYWSTYTVAGLTACMTILASVTQYCNYNDLADKHKDAALSYEDILNNLSAVKRRGPQEDTSFADVILDFDNQYLRVKTNAPLLSESIIKKHSKAEQDLFNSVNSTRTNTNDIESAVLDQNNSIENRAIEAEENAFKMHCEVKLLKSRLELSGFSYVAKNVLEILFRKVTKAKLITCIANWQEKVFNSTTRTFLSPSSTRDTIEDLEYQLSYYKNQLEQEKIIYQQELSRFRKEMEIASNEGVLRKEQDNDTFKELEKTNKCLRERVDQLLDEIDEIRKSYECQKHDLENEILMLKEELRKCREDN